jgi:hypothetical protein
MLDHPFVISTSRHITQGMVDLTDEKWDAASKTLSGTSQIVAGDPYELRIVTPGWNDSHPAGSASGAAIKLTQADTLVRTTIDSTNSRAVNWTIQFTR